MAGYSTWGCEESAMIEATEHRSGDRDAGSTHGSGRLPGGGHENPLKSILAWKIPWTEEPGG